MQVDMPNNYHKLTKSRLIDIILDRENIIEIQKHKIKELVAEKDKNKSASKSVTDMIFTNDFTVWEGEANPGITIRYDTYT